MITVDQVVILSIPVGEHTILKEEFEMMCDPAYIDPIKSLSEHLYSLDENQIDDFTDDAVAEIKNLQSLYPDAAYIRFENA